MSQSAARSIKRVSIAVITSLKTNVNIHIFICSISVLLDSQVGCTGPQTKRFFDYLSLFLAISYVWCERFDFVGQILFKTNKQQQQSVNIVLGKNVKVEKQRRQLHV